MKSALPESKKAVVFGFLILIIFLLPQLYFWNQTTDDAFISFRYVERLASNQGLTFNPGEKVEGFSNPLWIFILAGFFKITSINIITLSKIIGVLLEFITIFYLFKFTKLFKNSSDRKYIFATAVIILFLTPGLHIYATAGLEVPLLMTLIIMVFYYSYLGISFTTFLIFGLIGITRPEGPLYGILYLVLLLIKKEINKKVLFQSIAFFLPIVFYEIFRIYYFGQLLPNTAIAKPSGLFHDIYTIADYFTYIATLSFPLIIILLLSINKFKVSSSKILIYSSPLILANVIFLIYSNGDWMLFGRFFIPIWPILAFDFSFLLINFINYLWNESNRSINYLFIILSIIISSILIWNKPLITYFSNDNFSNLMKGADQLKVGKWLNNHYPAGTTVAACRLGGISYGAINLTFLDTYGLTDKDQALYRLNMPKLTHAMDNPILSKKPDLLAVLNDHGVRKVTIETIVDWDSYLRTNYFFVKSFPQGNNVFFEIWQNKNFKK